MKLPKQLEKLRDRKIWLCYPMIWNDTKHNGVGGYDKPPVSAYTLRNGSSNDSSNLATYDEAIAQIGKIATIYNVKGHDKPVEAEIKGVGLALGGTGICGLDLDNVAMKDPNGGKDEYLITEEATEILKLLNTYTEVSPSGNGLHLLFEGTLPDGIKKIAKPKEDIFDSDKAEYQLFSSGYMTISGKAIGDNEVAKKDLSELINFYMKYFIEEEEEVKPIAKPSTIRPAASTKYSSLLGSSSVVSNSSGITYSRWLDEISRLSDAEILDRIFMSGVTGSRVQALYKGDILGYASHSEADQALCSYLYSFTNDPDITERLFRSSGLYRASGKSRNYLRNTINKASQNRKELIGHIEFTADEKRQYAKQKTTEDQSAGAKNSKYSSLLKGVKNGRKKI